MAWLKLVGDRMLSTQGVHGINRIESNGSTSLRLSNGSIVNAHWFTPVLRGQGRRQALTAEDEEPLPMARNQLSARLALSKNRIRFVREEELRARAIEDRKS